ncbi:MAG TPA: STAS domain-containing protein [Spirochaetota bacterium]|nr:STAS domain-containing protein [Spirochaetota bacterium]HOM38615.1 STAS domain-containing protein [Spirochaetota bacterium]HPQ49752.1 STAS domain-containing protein [Spirochaetota bacterium]
MKESLLKLNEKLKIKDYTLIELSGEFDLNEVENFNSFFEKTKKNTNKIILDLSKLEYLDSSGTGCFVRLHNEIQAMNGDLIIYNPSDFIKDLFSISRLDSFLKIINTKEELDKNL